MKNEINNTPYGFGEDGSEVEYKAHQVTKHVTDNAEKRKREYQVRQSQSLEYQRRLAKRGNLYLEENG